MLRKITRREVLAALSTLGFAGAMPAASAMGRRPESVNKLPLRSIPGTAEQLPIVGLGSTKPVRMIETAGPGALESVMRMLMNYGGNVVDTAPRPAELDAKFGRVLQKPEFRDALWLTVKVNATGKNEGIAQFRQTQRLFGRDTFDLVQIESLTDLETHWPSLRGFKDAGHARYIGVTVAHERLYETLESFMKRESPDFVQLNYSVMERTAEDRLLPLAEDMGIPILVNGPFMNGDYFGLVSGRELPDWSAEFDCESWAQFSLKYILAHPAVTCVLTETTKAHHMEDNVRAGLGRFPDAATKQRMREFAKNL